MWQFCSIPLWKLLLWQIWLLLWILMPANYIFWSQFLDVEDIEFHIWTCMVSLQEIRFLWTFLFWFIYGTFLFAALISFEALQVWGKWNKMSASTILFIFVLTISFIHLPTTNETSYSQIWFKILITMFYFLSTWTHST